jgi:hypothetical protein
MFELIRASTCSLVNSYIDVFVGDFSAKTVLAELARCLSLFENLHTVQIESTHVESSCRPTLAKLFRQTFEKFSYPQIRNVFIMYPTLSLVASCPQARLVGFTRNCSWPDSVLLGILGNCPHLEELEHTGDLSWTDYTCNSA